MVLSSFLLQLPSLGREIPFETTAPGRHTCDIPRSCRVFPLLTPLPDGPSDGLNLPLLAFTYPIFLPTDHFYVNGSLWYYRVSY